MSDLIKKETDLSKIPIHIEKSHPCIQDCIVDMIAANYQPFYGEFALYLSYVESKEIGTMGVTVTNRGAKLIWNRDFVEKQVRETMNFLIIHEISHLLLDHVERSVGYDHRFANLAQDMIINTIIYEDIVLDEHGDKVTMPKDEYGNNSGVFVPKEYPHQGDVLFEELYQWLKQDYQKWKEKKEKEEEEEESNEEGNCPGGNGKGKGEGEKGEGNNGEGREGGEGNDDEENGDGEGNSNGEGNSKKNDYGKNARPIKSKNGKVIEPDMYSLDSFYENIEKSKGMTLDSHVQGGEDIPKEVKREIVDRILNTLQNRGLMTGNNILDTLRKLRKSEKDYLKEIKRSITNDIMSGKKAKSITRPNRKGIQGLKGKRKFKQKINAILDTSGSMIGEFDKALSFIFQNDISINLIQVDTEVQDVVEIKDKRQLNNFLIQGLGGTTLTPAIKHVADTPSLNKYNTVILTDGYTDNLDCRGVKGNILILSTGEACPIMNSNGKVKQIVVKK